MHRPFTAFVEGPSDARFFDRIVKPNLRKVYAPISVVEYAHLPDRIVNGFIRTLNSSGEGYVLLCDVDDYACVPSRLDSITGRHPELPRNKVQVVVREIEGWYLAGVSRQHCHRLKLRASKLSKGTNELTKENLSSFREQDSPLSVIELMTSICGCFQIALARQRNRSFNRFCSRFLPGV